MDEKNMQTRNVNNLMRHVWFLALLAVIALAGCDGDDKKAITTGGSEPPVDIANPGEMTIEQKEEMLDAGAIAAAAAVARIKIPEPGAGDWEPTTDNLNELGNMVDTALFEMVNARCDARITLGVPIGVTDLQVRADIKSASTFNIRFVIPAYFDALDNVAIADGKRRAMLLGKEWEELPAFSSMKSTKMDSDDLDQFVISFTKEMYAPYLDGETVWEPLFTALQNGVGGYKAVVERQLAEGRGQQRPLIRVYASTDEGTPTELEIVIDEERMVPVTVRVVQKQEDDFEFKMMWTGVWAFGGGSYESNAFVIPTDAFINEQKN